MIQFVRGQLPVQLMPPDGEHGFQTIKPPIVEKTALESDSEQGRRIEFDIPVFVTNANVEGVDAG